MQIIQNQKVKEKLYIEKLENGLTIMCIPKKGINKKFIIYGTHYGSIDNIFTPPGKKETIEVPNGVAHFLEHKMFEQENGQNSLDVLMGLGVNPNAYTTNDHTAYLFESIENFYPALDELMDYIQHPYFTDENVEKEKGIIEQEIAMYDDYPDWVLYMNLLKALYKNHPINIDITGTRETIAKIDKNVLYDCYNTFYHPSNMAVVVCGDFEPEQIVEEISKRLIKKENMQEIKRQTIEEPKEIVKNEVIQEMQVSMPLFVIGIKDIPPVQEKNIVKKHIAIEILLNILVGKSSELYKELYKQGLIMTPIDISYEFSKDYAYVLLQGQSKQPKKVLEKFFEQIEKMKKEGINEQDFQRTKKMIYGDYIKEYNSVQTISQMFIADYFKGINSFDYLEEYSTVTEEYAKQVLEDVFIKKQTAISIIE